MYKYNVKFCLFLLNMSGLHPEKTGCRFQDILFFLAMSSNVIVFGLTVSFILFSANTNLTDVTSSMESLLLIVHGFLKTINLYSQRFKLKKLLRQLPNFWKIDQVEDEAVKAACFGTMRTLRALTVVYTILAGSSVAAIAVLPILSKKLVFTSYIPEDIPYNCLFALHTYAYIMGVFNAVIGTDYLYMTLVLLIKLQFQLLNYDIRNLFPIVAPQDVKTLHHRIKHWVDYHNYMLDFVRLFNEIFSLALFFYFGIIILATCMELFIISIQPPGSNSFKYYTYTFVLFFEFIAFYCLPGQIVINEAEKIRYNIWASDWKECPSTSVKTAMNMILMRSQQTVSIRAGIVDANFQTCLATLKTISSYYMFLRTMSEGTN
nr:odorant receptor [Semanotus bifasciatus]